MRAAILAIVYFVPVVLAYLSLIGPDVVEQGVTAVKRPAIARVVDNPMLRRQTPPAKSTKYDFSVTREALAPVAQGDGSDPASGPGGWVTVVEARDLSGGWVTVIEARDLAASQSLSGGGQWLPMWFAALLVVAGSLILGWRNLPRLASAMGSSGVQRPQMRQAVAGIVTEIGKYIDQAIQFFASQAKPSQETDTSVNNGAEQINLLLAQIEQVVAKLNEGSPLRDVLEQELRLIHYRISAATSAAGDGNDVHDRSAARFRVLVRELERVRRIADSAAASIRDPRDRLALPETRSEAYALLGVNADVSPTVLKKLVDALRMTWHPDHARNESDRLLREERIKQINIAWELVTGDISTQGRHV